MSPDKIEIYWYGEFGWNVTAARKLVADRQPTRCDIASWVAELSLATINEAHWPLVDLTQPLIVVPMPGTDEHRLIDGWHRVRRASVEGITALPVYILSRDEEYKIRGYGGGKA